MLKNYIAPVLLFFVVLIIQIIIVPLIAIQDVVPDLILILLVFYTLKNGQLYGTILGFIFGLLFDLITGGMIGSAMFSKTLSGFIAGYFYNENRIHQYYKSLTFPLIIILCSLIDSVTLTFISNFDLNVNLFRLIVNKALFPAIFTAVISLLVIIFYPKRSYI
ncbi:MAG: hypothetical protein STSR0008_02690 [Ignavibacterium sp.]